MCTACLVALVRCCGAVCRAAGGGLPTPRAVLALWWPGGCRDSDERLAPLRAPVPLHPTCVALFCGTVAMAAAFVAWLWHVLRELAPSLTPHARLRIAVNMSIVHSTGSWQVRR